MESKQNNFVFKALNIVAWIIFIGLSIEAGALIVNFLFGVFNPEFVPNLYPPLDLSEMYQLNQFWVDSQAYILMAAVIYVIAAIFKKGIELQAENDLTV